MLGNFSEQWQGRFGNDANTSNVEKLRAHANWQLQDSADGVTIHSQHAMKGQAAHSASGSDGTAKLVENALSAVHN
jgi:hypothetical protein